MTDHHYQPGDPIEVLQDGVWEHDGRTFVGVLSTGRMVIEYDWVVYDRNPAHVRPYVPPIEIPEGWRLMNTGDLRHPVHEVYNANDSIDTIVTEYLFARLNECSGALVVAREIGNQ